MVKNMGRQRSDWGGEETLWFWACSSASPADAAAGFQPLEPAAARQLLGDVLHVKPASKYNQRCELALSKSVPLQVSMLQVCLHTSPCSSMTQLMA
jgi:hypothetical protein